MSDAVDNDDDDYVKLMCDCWTESSLVRPTFCQVVASLEDMSELCVL